MHNYILFEEAQLDFEESLQWYLSKSITAAENFIEAIHDTINLICEHPYRWRNTYNNYHELSCKKFPFVIVYLINTVEKLIIIVSIYHHKRSPKGKFVK